MRPVILVTLESCNFVLGTFDITNMRQWWRSAPFPGNVKHIHQTLALYAEHHIAICEMTNGTYSVFRTDDYGLNWYSVLNVPDKINGVVKVDFGWAILYTDGGDWYESTRSGASWTKVLDSGPRAGRAIKVADDVFLAHDGDAIWRSTDICRSWTQTYNIHQYPIADDDMTPKKRPPPVGTKSAPAIDGTYSRCFAACGEWLLESFDGGASWISCHGWNSYYGSYWDAYFPQFAHVAGTTIQQILAISVNGPLDEDVQFAVSTFCTTDNKYRLFVTWGGIVPTGTLAGRYFGNWWFKDLLTWDFLPGYTSSAYSMDAYDVLVAGTQYTDRVLACVTPVIDPVTQQITDQIILAKNITTNNGTAYTQSLVKRYLEGYPWNFVTRQRYVNGAGPWGTYNGDDPWLWSSDIISRVNGSFVVYCVKTSDSPSVPLYIPPTDPTAFLDSDNFSGNVINRSRWVDLWATGSGTSTYLDNGQLAMTGVIGGNCGVMTSAGYVGPNTTLNARIKLTGDGVAFMRLYVDDDNVIVFGPLKTAGGDELAYFGVMQNGVYGTTQNTSGRVVDGEYHNYTMMLRTDSISLYLDGTFLTRIYTPTAVGSYKMSLIAADLVNGTAQWDDYTKISGVSAVESLPGRETLGFTLSPRDLSEVRSVALIDMQYEDPFYSIDIHGADSGDYPWSYLISEIRNFLVTTPQPIQVEFETLKSSEYEIYDGDPEEEAQLTGPLLEENFMKRIWVAPICQNNGVWDLTQLFVRRCISLDLDLITIKDYHKHLYSRTTLLKHASKSLAIDILYYTTYTKDLLIDSLVKTTLQSSLYQDALVLKTVSRQQLCDAVIVLRQLRPLPMDAVIRFDGVYPYRMHYTAQGIKEKECPVEMKLVQSHELDLIDQIEYYLIQMLDFRGTGRPRRGVFDSKKTPIEGI